VTAWSASSCLNCFLGPGDYNSTVIKLLRGVPIFAGLEERALELLLEHTTLEKYPEGGVIVREGEISNVLYIIGDGSVRLFKHFGGDNQVELVTLHSKDFFGEMCILDTLPRSATIQAASPTTVYTISSTAFHHLYQKMPAQHSILLLNIARDLSRRLRAVDELFAARH
jgi:CRP-like cAMP-binding protein